jgi:hypothetical protein
LLLEQFEGRLVPTTSLFLDFGDNLTGTNGMTTDGTNSVTHNNFISQVNGPNFGLGTGVPGSTIYTFTSFAASATAAGFTSQQITDMELTILATVRSYYAPFDVNVTPLIGNNGAQTLNDIAGHLTNGAAYVLVEGVTPSAGSISSGLNGQAGGNDLTAQTNATADTAVALANHLFTNGSASTAIGVNQSSLAFAYTIAHEAGHTFGLRHTDNANSATNALLTDSDMISQFYNQQPGAPLDQRFNFNMFSRFPLNESLTEPWAGGTENPYAILAANLGLAPNGPLYVTGTGANDIISLAQSTTDPNSITVNVQPFNDINYTSAITVPGTTKTTYSYTIPRGTQPIRIDAGAGNDRIIINANVSSTVTVYGMAGTDELIVQGNNAASGSYSPRPSPIPSLDGNQDQQGTISIGNTTVTFLDFASNGADTASKVTVQNVQNFTFTAAGDSALTVDSPAFGQTRVTGAVAIPFGGRIVPLILKNVSSLTLNVSQMDGIFPPTASVSVLGSAANLTIISTQGTGHIMLGDAGHNLSGIRSMSVTGDGLTTVELNDAGNAARLPGYRSYQPQSTSFTIDGGQLTRVDIADVFITQFFTGVKYQTTVSYSGLASLTIDGGPAVVVTPTTYLVRNTPGPITINAHGTDAVMLGDAAHNLSFFSPVTVTGNGNTTLEVNDAGNAVAGIAFTSYQPVQTKFTVDGGQLTRFALANVIFRGQSTPTLLPFSATVGYSGIAGLTIDGGPAVAVTPTTYQVLNTPAPVTINAHGTDAVMLGDASHNLSLFNAVTVTGNGRTTVEVNDAGNYATPAVFTSYQPVQTTFMVDVGHLTRTTFASVVLPGQSIPIVLPFTTMVGYSGLAGLTIDGGPAVAVTPTTYQVLNTPAPVTISAHGTDAVMLGDSSHNLSAIGSVSAAGSVTVNGNGSTSVEVDDRGNSVVPPGYSEYVPQQSTQFTIDAGELSRRATALIVTASLPSPTVARFTTNVHYSGLASLIVDSGAAVGAPTPFHILNTLGTNTVAINAHGSDSVMLGDAGHNLSAINSVTVTGNGSTTVEVNDAGNAVTPTGYSSYMPLSTAFTIDTGRLNRMAVANVVFTGQSLPMPFPFTTTVGYSGLVGLTIDGGPAVAITPTTYQVLNTAGIISPPASAAVTINAHGADAVTITDANTTINGIQGTVNVNGDGNTTLNVDDSGNPVTENYTVAPTSIRRSIIIAGVYNFNTAPINFFQIANVAVHVGSAKMGLNQGVVINSLDVVGTKAGTVTDLYGNNEGGQTEFAAYPFVFNYAGPIQGAVHFHGSTIGFDTVDYVDFLNPAAQTYTMSGTMTTGQMVDQGFAAVTYDGSLYDVGLETSVVGRSKVNVLSTAAVGFGTVVSANAGDVITVGSRAPNLGGNLSGLAASGRLVIRSIFPNSAASVILDDSTDTQTNKQVAFGSDSFGYWGMDGLAPQRIDIQLGTASSVQVLGGSPAAGQSGGNTYSIPSTLASTALALEAGTGGDIVNVGSATSTLDPIQGTVTVNGQGGNTTLNVFDQGTSSYQIYQLSGTQFLRYPTPPPGQPLGNPTQTINYSKINHLNIHGGNASDTWYVNSTLAGTTTDLYSAGGSTSTQNEFAVYDSAGTLNSIQGPLALHGGGGGPYDYAVAYDYNNTVGHTFTLSANAQTGTLTRDGIAPITFDGIIELVVYVPRVGGNHFNVQAVLPTMAAILTASNGDQDVVGSLPNLGMTAVQGNVRFGFEVTQVTAPVWLTLDDSADQSTTTRQVTIGAASPPDRFRYVTNLAGNGASVGWDLPTGSTVKVLGRLGGNETFAIQALQPSLAPVIQAGGPNNTLDYSAYTGDVAVNLPLGTATQLAGISGIQNVTGSNGNNLIVGDANPNVLIGGTGRNIIIGGGAADIIRGGGGDNILIAGATLYDQKQGALDAIFAEWTSNDSLATRMADISGGTPSGLDLNGSNVLVPAATRTHAATVFDDAAVDQLFDGTGLSWFFVHQPDDVINNGAGPSLTGDVVTFIRP